MLDADGTLHQTGYFGNRKPLAERLGLRRGLRQLNKSAVYRRLSNGGSRINDGDIRLYLAVVRRSQEFLNAHYPGLQFHVILWPNQDAPQQRYAYEKMREVFRQTEIPIHLVEDILPGYNTDRSPYILSSADHHPNALANRLPARYALNKIVQ